MIISAGWILPICPENLALESYSLVVNKNKIFDLIETPKVHAKYQTDQHIHLPEHVLMPGLINAHTHLAKVYFRGLGDDLPFLSWLRERIHPAESAVVSPGFIKDGTTHALAESIRCGVTCINDHFFYEESVVDALKISGLRGCVAHCAFTFPMPWSKTIEDDYVATEQLREYVGGDEKNKNDGKIKFCLGPHSPYGTDDKIMEYFHQQSKQHGAPIHIHLHETIEEIENFTNQYGMSPVKFYNAKGWLNKKFIAVHMVHATDEELDMLAEAGVSVVHCPESNMKFGNGMAQIQKMLDKGINVALATDGAASNNDLDMIGEMRSASFMGKLCTSTPTALNSKSVLEMATINGAKALGIDDKVGSLEIGKDADFIAIDMHRIETQPMYNPISQIVYATCREQVTDMWVAGKPIMRNRHILTLCEQTILQKQFAWKAKIKEAVNIL